MDIELPEPVVFQWDHGNDKKNSDKHDVSIKEAEEQFYDAYKLLLADDKHSDKENRYILIGKTQKGRLLFSVFTIRKNKIRIISTRDAHKKERIKYEKSTT